MVQMLLKCETDYINRSASLKKFLDSLGFIDNPTLGDDVLENKKDGLIHFWDNQQIVIEGPESAQFDHVIANILQIMQPSSVIDSIKDPMDISSYQRTIDPKTGELFVLDKFRITNVYDCYGQTGSTHKMMGIDEVVMDAFDGGVDTISIISSGNYLDALLWKISMRGLGGELNVINLVNYSAEEGELEIKDERILRYPKEREKYVRDNFPNVGNVKDYTDFIPEELEFFAEDMLVSNPDYVSLGIGTGKLFVVLYRKIKEKNLETKIIGVMPKSENGVLSEGNFSFTSVADKLSTPYTSFKDEILQAQSEGHILFEAVNSDFRRANKEAVKRSYESEMSGSAGFVIYDEEIRRKCGIEDDANVLIVNTGKGKEEEKPRPWYYRLAKPVVGIASLLLITGLLDYGYKTHKRNKIDRGAAISTAKIAAKNLKENPNFDDMSTNDVWDYVKASKKGIGGPPHYW